MPAPRIFISHSSQEADFTRDLAKALTEAGADAWYLDQRGLGPIEIGPTVERELRERNVFIVVLSPAAQRSEWVELESRWYWNLWRLEKDTRFILPVLAANIALTMLWPFLGDFKRVEESPGVALPKELAIQQTLLELGLTLTVGDYPSNVVDVIRRKYVDLGAIASGLGRPMYPRLQDATQQISQCGTSGYSYPFQHGVICWCEKAGAHPIWHGVYTVFERLSNHADTSTLRFPLTDELTAAPSPYGTEGVFQRFEGPGKDYPDEVIEWLDHVRCGATVYWSERYGVHPTWEAIGAVYELAHGTAGYLGFPISDELDAAASPRKTEGKHQNFEGGTIYWCLKAGAHPVHGEISKVYHQAGGTASRLGFPVTGELAFGPGGAYAASAFGTTGTLQRFEGKGDYPGVKDHHTGVAFGSTIYHTERGSYATWSGIGRCYEQLGGASSALGVPTSPEWEAGQSPQGTVGYYQAFEGGSIHWCEKYDSVPIIGRILDIYNRHGGSGGEFGFPIAPAEVTPAENGRTAKSQRFEGGVIYVEE